MDLALKGKNVLVTGATKGIGRSIAETFAAEGANLGICARNAGEVEAMVAQLRGKGVKAFGSAFDVADLGALKKWINDMAGELGGIDAYVSNVSALGTVNSDEAWERSFQIDIRASVVGAETVLPYLEKAEDGSIVFVNTNGSVQVFAQPTPYPVVKAGGLAFMNYLSSFLAPKRIRVNAVSPGSIFFEGGVWDRRRINEPERYERMLKLNPMGRFGKPEEVANAVVFLSSPVASFISGTNLVVDGAATVRIQN
jgi:3-oxoacyl-[acyl-carrier protein] reductase